MNLAKIRKRLVKAGKNPVRVPAWVWFMTPSMLGVAYFVLLPFGDVVRRSFFSALSGQFTGLSNFRTVFHNQAFRLAVKNTVRFTAVCMPVLIGMGLWIAVKLSRLKRLRTIKALFLFPMAMPAAAVVLIWRMVFDRMGFLNGLLDCLFCVPDHLLCFLGGLPCFPDGLRDLLSGNVRAVSGGSVRIAYMDTAYAFWVLVFSYVWKNLGYTVVLWMAGLKGIPDSITEAARMDGAEERQIFWHVVFPNLKGSLYTITVLSLLNSFKVFREAYLVSGAYPQESIYLLQHLFNNWFVNMEPDKMAAAAVLLAAALLVLIVAPRKGQVEWN